MTAMRVAELIGLREFRLVERHIADPGPGEAQVRVQAVGVCGSDLHAYAEGGIGGKLNAYPMVLGHEPAGVVAKVGSGVSGWQPGDRAAFEPAMYCYHCEFCMSGHHNLCEKLRFLSSPGDPGFFREYVNLPAGNLLALPPYGHISRSFADVTVIIARVPEIDLDGFEIFIPSTVVGAAKGKFHAAGVAQGTPETWEIARIESGRPQWGVDMDDSTLPQEANFDELGAISYTKGCYIGQETVARVHFRGHVNRFLRRLRFVTRPAPPKGAELVDETGKVIGEIRSAALSPRFGGVALGMVRREIPPGTTLQARWPDGECAIQVEQNEKGATV